MLSNAGFFHKGLSWLAPLAAPKSSRNFSSIAACTLRDALRTEALARLALQSYIAGMVILNTEVIFGVMHSCAAFGAATFRQKYDSFTFASFIPFVAFTSSAGSPTRFRSSKFFVETTYKTIKISPKTRRNKYRFTNRTLEADR